MEINNYIIKLTTSFARQKQLQATSVHLNSPSEYQVASNTKHNKERAKCNEINVEVCVLHIQFFENIVTFLKDACTFAVLLTFKWFPVISIDRLQDSLKWIPTQSHNALDSSWSCDITISQLTNLFICIQRIYNFVWLLIEWVCSFTRCWRQWNSPKKRCSFSLFSVKNAKRVHL